MNEQNTVEIEVKIQVSDLSSIAERLTVLGARLHKMRVFERNVRYENQTKTLTAQGIVVRLRSDDQVRLTYKSKGIARDDGLMAREELEVTINDFDLMSAILEKLGYSPYMVYEKYRTTYHYRDCEVVLDEMPYGDFIEVEGLPDAIEAVLRSLNLHTAKRITRSYAAIFDVIKGHLGLTFTDLTFDNFADVNVPDDAIHQHP